MNNREYALSIVVPTYNEKDNINALFERLDASVEVERLKELMKTE